MRRAAATALTGALVALAAPAIAACGSHSSCVPAALQLSGTTVSAGGTTVLSSPASSCRLHGVTGATYVVTLQTLGRSAPALVARVRPAPDGSFSVTVRVPTTASPGQAVLSVAGSAFDASCQAHSGKCAGYAVGLSIAP
ncbi:hypothetical protein acdb102_44450 [Acidothermaceae bacterium B102]|nr:hypothetical protein acdb102_44450 [Acidothermaceae bacterium B102]